MRVNRAILNVILLSCGYAVIFTIQTWFYIFLHHKTWDCGKSRLIFDMAFIICVLLAPSYVKLSGTRIALLTSYVCHVFYMMSFIWPHTKIIYAGSAILGLGAAFFFVAQGQCLTENSNSRTVHRQAWIFWLFLQIFLLFRDLLTREFLPEFYDKGSATRPEHTMKIIIFLTFIVCGAVVFFVREPPQEYSSGGLECIPNGKVIESEESSREILWTLWKPFKDELGLFVSYKMLVLSLMLGYVGLMENIRYSKYSDDTTTRMADIHLRIGEILGALFSAFCFCNKNGDSAIIVFMGLVMLAASLSFTSINVLQNKDNCLKTPDNLSAEKLSYFRSMAMLERFSFGFGDACFHTQIYSLLGVLFPRKSVSAFGLAGLYYWVGYSFGMNYISSWNIPSQLRFYLATGMLTVISVTMAEILYVDRSSDIAIEKESLKSKEIPVKSAKNIPAEIKMLYAGYNNNEENQEHPISTAVPEVQILSEK